MNVTLIGMPGSGKSFIGQKLADRLGVPFIGPDTLLEHAHGMPLQQVLEHLGDKAFLQAEEDMTLSVLSTGPFVLSPGGSIIYSDAAMRRISEVSKVVYLKASIDVLENRIGGVPRGIVGSQAKTLAELYKEREPLYKKWAQVTVDADQPAEAVVKEIVEQILNS